MKKRSAQMDAYTLRNALAVLIYSSAMLLGVPGATVTAHAEVTGALTPEQSKALEESQYALALTAATWGGPAVIMYTLRYNDALQHGAPAAPNGIWRMGNIPGPDLAEKAGYVLPNYNVVYGFGFLDLRAEPVILNLPDSHGLYYMVESVDMWTNAFAYPAGVDAGYKGGKVAYVAPGWKGTLPPGVKRIDAPTPWVLLQPRVHVANQAALAEANKVLSAITVEPLSTYLGKRAPEAQPLDYPAPDRIDLKQPVSAMNFRDPLQFWEILSKVMNENPPPKEQVEGLLPMFKQIGLEIGKQWDRSKLDPVTLKAMTRAAQDMPNVVSNVFVGGTRNGWISGGTMGTYGTDYTSRAYVARVGLTANTIKEAVYVQSVVDGTGQSLSGTKRYTMTFKADPPFHKPGFWALRMYDATNLYPTRNPLNRYSIGSDNNMKRNADGTVTVYLQPDSPGPDKESNWLPTPPKHPFMLILGTYAPDEALIKFWSDPTAFTFPPAVEVK